MLLDLVIDMLEHITTEAESHHYYSPLVIGFDNLFRQVIDVRILFGRLIDCDNLSGQLVV